MSSITRLSSVATRSITSAPSSTSVLPGCEETYLSSIFDTYCTAVVANPPSCTVDTAPCCTSQVNFASSIYACVASHAGNCATISGLNDCSSFANGFSGSATSTSADSSGPILSTSTSAPSAKTTSAFISVGNASQSIASQSTAAQSSAAATSSKSGAIPRVDGGLKTMGVVGIIGGVAMWFLGGGL